MQSNFIAVLCGEKTDSAVVETESIYVLFEDTFQTIISLPQKVIIASDGSSINIGPKGGIVTKFRDKKGAFLVIFHFVFFTLT